MLSTSHDRAMCMSSVVFHQCLPWHLRSFSRRVHVRHLCLPRPTTTTPCSPSCKVPTRLWPNFLKKTDAQINQSATSFQQKAVTSPNQQAATFPNQTKANSPDQEMATTHNQTTAALPDQFFLKKMAIVSPCRKAGRTHLVCRNA